MSPRRRACGPSPNSADPILPVRSGKSSRRSAAPDMARFAANLTWLFTEYDFLDRFDAAADCGFDAVEVLFPYDYPAEAIAQRLARNKLSMALINTPSGNIAAGERGLAALAGRATHFRDNIALAADYAETTGAGLVHVMAGMA